MAEFTLLYQKSIIYFWIVTSCHATLIVTLLKEWNDHIAERERGRGRESKECGMNGFMSKVLTHSIARLSSFHSWPAITPVLSLESICSMCVFNEWHDYISSCYILGQRRKLFMMWVYNYRKIGNWREGECQYQTWRDVSYAWKKILKAEMILQY